MNGAELGKRSNVLIRGLRRAGFLILIAVCGYFGWSYLHKGVVQVGAPATEQATKAVPVTVAEAKIADFQVYLNGLGTVEPYDTVTVRSRVDGAVNKVFFKQGQMVKEGDTLVQIDPRPYQAALDQATAKKAQDEASLENAKVDLKRYETLVKEDAGSRQQADTQQAAVNQLIAQIKGDQAAIDSAQTQFSYTTILSPLTGLAGFRSVDPGNIVHASDTTGIVTIIKLQPISVVFTASEDEIPGIRKALVAGTVPVIALSSDGSRTLSDGHLQLVNNLVDEASGTIRMKATFANTDNALWPGLSVQTRLLVDTLKQVLVVPDDAVQRGDRGLYAYVVGEGGKAELHDIQVIQEGNGMSVVAAGLAAGQKVVVAGQYRLQQGVLVQPSEASQQASTPIALPNPTTKAP